MKEGRSPNSKRASATDDEGATLTFLYGLVSRPEVELIATIRDGVQARFFADAAKIFSLPVSDLARKLGVEKHGLNRQINARAKLSADSTERLLRCMRVRHLAQTIFTDEAAISRWLLSPAPALGGGAPIDLLDTAIGVRAVEELIHGIAQGNTI